MRPFEGIKVIDITHVLAGPFAAYQLALLGADVIKVETPDEGDQSRGSGSDRALNRRKMGTGYLTQGSNKRAITLNLKTEAGREILKKLVADADVLVENFRAGAFPALGLGYEELSRINPRLIYCSMTAFGQEGPRGGQTAYDHVIQATSGLMAATGTPEANPIKVGAPVLDYATGTMCAFALSAALFQRERTGKGQHIDSAMLDVALILMSSHLTGYFRTGAEPKPKGNSYHFATNSCYETKDGLVMLGASNRGQHERMFRAVGRPDLAEQSGNEQREELCEAHAQVLREIMKERTAQEWEEYLQARHVPAARVRPMAEAVADPQLQHRGVVHRHNGNGDIPGDLTVPLAAFRFAHGGPSIETPPPRLGQHNAEVLGARGYSADQIEAFRRDGVI